MKFITVIYGAGKGTAKMVLNTEGCPPLQSQTPGTSALVLPALTGGCPSRERAFPTLLSVLLLSRVSGGRTAYTHYMCLITEFRGFPWESQPAAPPSSERSRLAGSDDSKNPGKYPDFLICNLLLALREEAGLRPACVSFTEPNQWNSLRGEIGEMQGAPPEGWWVDRNGRAAEPLTQLPEI